MTSLAKLEGLLHRVQRNRARPRVEHAEPGAVVAGPRMAGTIDGSPAAAPPSVHSPSVHSPSSGTSPGRLEGPAAAASARRLEASPLQAARIDGAPADVGRLDPVGTEPLMRDVSAPASNLGISSSAASSAATPSPDASAHGRGAARPAAAPSARDDAAVRSDGGSPFDASAGATASAREPLPERAPPHATAPRGEPTPPATPAAAARQPNAPSTPESDVLRPEVSTLGSSAAREPLPARVEPVPPVTPDRPLVVAVPGLPTLSFGVMVERSLALRPK